MSSSLIIHVMFCALSMTESLLSLLRFLFCLFVVSSKNPPIWLNSRYHSLLVQNFHQRSSAKGRRHGKCLTFSSLNDADFSPWAVPVGDLSSPGLL